MIHFYKILNALILTLLLSACQQQSIVMVDAIHVSGKHFSGDALVIRFPDGTTHLIDTGLGRFTRSDLIPFLKSEKIKRIDSILVTHAHTNHYEGLLEIAKVVEVGEIYFNLPNKTACDRQTWAGACDYPHVLKAHKAIQDLNIPLKSIDGNHVLYTQDDIEFKTIFYLGAEAKTPKGWSINDESVVAKLIVGKHSMLFTGDLNIKAGNYMLEKKIDLNADIVLLPHHGVTGTVPNAFIENTHAKYAIVSNTENHWLGKRGDQLRNLMSKLSIPTYITGIDGNIHIELSAESINITTQNPRP
ncbi:MAG: MBL fold metallo-hydrolase [Arenicellales bacterium]